MKNIKDFKNVLSKKQMGNINGGKMYKCSITEADGENYNMYYNFNSGQDLLNWYASLPWGTKAECTPFQTANDDLISNPIIDMPMWP